MGEPHVNSPEQVATDDTRSLSRNRAIGWGLVAVQGLLIVGILLTPVGDAWPLPAAAAAFATALTWLGLALVVWAVLVFGRGVTPSPMPSRKAQLQTRGPYRWIRHPMYTGVIVLMAGSAMGRKSWVAAALWVVLVMFFLTKMGWEERRLVENYPGYHSYRTAVPALIPIRRRSD
ncbi:MAG TPA: isoprenylcysteine carboxylmethyltransferase family protein [Acidimicrobiia bacterium]|nr:isoprenylcysteine carboxylmethyltransferase family protein [Acidimicrobiia bacterium]